MKNEGLWKEYIKNTSLSVFGIIGISLYILADTFFVAKGLGANGLAALNLAIPVYNFIHGSGLMLGMGGATKYTIFKSQKNAKNADIIFTNTMYLAFIFSVIFVLTGLFLSETLASSLGADQAVFAMTSTYIKVLLLFAPAFLLNDILLCFVRNDKNPSLSMYAMIGGSLSNIILDYIFIFPCKMGIFGAVFATGLAPIISVLIMAPHWTLKKKGFHFIKTSLLPQMVKINLSLGFPSLFEQLSSAIVIITFNAVILHLRGNVGVAAYGVVANLSLVVTAVYTGIAQGIQPMVSRSYGCGKIRTGRRVLHYAMASMLIVSCVLYLAICLFAGPIAGAFNSENNLQLQQIAAVGLRLYFTAIVFAGFNIIISMFLISTEKPFPAHIISLFRGLLVIVPVTLLLSALWGMTGVWLSFPITELFVAVLGGALYFRYKK